MALALDIRDLRKTYTGGVEALGGIDLQVEEGELFALLGPNGAGKSTIIGIVTSLVRKTGGSVRVFDVDIDVDHAQAKGFIGLVPQEFNFNQFEKVANVLVNQAGYYGVPRRIARTRSEELLHKLGLWDKRATPARRLSGGMKRRLMIARALVHRPRLLILDEPTAGVDIELRRSMWDFLRQLHADGTTIILTTHYLEEAEQMCREVAIIHHGAIIERAGTRELLERLHRETFILDVDPLDTAPTLDGFACRRVDAGTLEVDVERRAPLNGLFAELAAAGITVRSMRNKANRLEEIFVSLTGADDATEAPCT